MRTWQSLNPTPPLLHRVAASARQTLNLITLLSTRHRLNINEERLIAAICRANRSARWSAFSSAPSSCPAKPSGNFTPGEIPACEWHANGCALVPLGLGTRIQLQSAQRYMTTREMNAINGRCVSAILIFRKVFWIQILSWHMKRNKLLSFHYYFCHRIFPVCLLFYPI